MAQPPDVLGPVIATVLPVVTAGLTAVVAVLGSMIALAVAKFGAKAVLGAFTGAGATDPDGFDPDDFPIEPARFGGAVGSAGDEAFPDLDDTPWNAEYADTMPMVYADEDAGLWGEDDYRDEWRG